VIGGKYGAPSEPLRRHSSPYCELATYRCCIAEGTCAASTPT
jgi:hypothetical protein